MCAPDPPAAPDPVRTAQAQGAVNRDTAIAQQTMNFVDQTTPDWTLQYQKIEDVPYKDSLAGFDSGLSGLSSPQQRHWVADPNPGTPNDPQYRVWQGGSGSEYGGSGGGQFVDSRTGQPWQEGSGGGHWENDTPTYTVPRYRAVQTLSPEAQARYDLSNKVQKNLLGAADAQTQRLQELFANPFEYKDLPSLDNTDVEGRLYDLATRRLVPQQARDEEALRARLANQGIRLGSEAYDNALRGFGETKNDALNQLLLTGHSQAFGEALQSRQQMAQEQTAERTLPINEITALLHGGQINAPNYISPPQTNIAAPNYEGDVNAAYSGQMQAYNQQVAAQNAAMGGIFGTLGNIATAGIKYSDKRLKENIKPVGKTKGGLVVYLYNYKGEPTTEMGVMAQDVEKKRPGAVHEVGGFKAVDYAKVA